MPDRASGSVVSRLAVHATRVARGVALGWVLVVALVLPTARTAPSLWTIGFACGAVALWALAMIGIGTVVASALSALRRGGEAPVAVPWRTIARSYAASLAIATLAFVALRPQIVDGWLPAYFTHRAPIVVCARLGLASAIGFALVGAWTWGRRRRPAEFPLWLVGLHVLVLRIAAHDAIGAVFDRNGWLLDLGSLLLVSASAFAVLPNAPSPRVRRALSGVLGVLAASAAAVVLGYGPQIAARADLREQFPSPADLMGLVQRGLDLDGDGYAAALGGLDCDDSDPAVSPGALEVVGNGIDDNCAGGDLADPVAPPAPPKRVRGRARSVVLLTVDALRVDHVEPETMPHLAQFASASAAFERVYTQAPFTDNAIRSLMTGRYPMDFDGVSQFFGQEPSLAELMAAAGYRTHAIKANALLTPYAFMGFATIDDTLVAANEAHDAVSSPQTADAAIAAFDRLDAGERPFFLWAHFIDPHVDYMPHPEAPFGGDSEAQRYRQEVWFADQHVGRVLDHLDAAGFFERGIVVVTSDHGELLGEHGVSGHANWLYEAAVRVPLLVRGAAVPTGPQATRVRLVDLYPTLLELAAGIDADSDGRSLTELWSGGDTEDRDVFARTTYGGQYLRAGWVGDAKLIQDVLRGTEALYDVASDPAEARNRIDEDPEGAQRLRDAIGRRWDRSVNDHGLARKQALLPSRRVEPKVWAEFDRAVQQRDCQRGDAAACARLRATGGE